MFKNRKFFLPPPNDESDFKELFRRAAAAGAGRPVTKDGFPDGPWTPELLAAAISEIDANQVGIDLRTVQLWFQENDKGISPANIRWLARVLGCDDPAATTEWQIEIMAAQSRLTAQRRGKRRNGGSIEAAEGEDEASAEGVAASTEMAPHDVSTGSESERGFSLAMRSEAIFSRGSPLDIPSTVFAGAVALGFLSYLLDIHDVTYTRDDGFIKQVGFLWAPNWTFLFMVFMPLFFVFVGDLLAFWKNEGRSKLIPNSDRAIHIIDWSINIKASSYTYWAALVICVYFAGFLQWFGVRLMPLLRGEGDTAPDWGSLAIERPDVVSTAESIVFTGLAYLYMCLCFYLFFVGLILLYTMAHDLWRIGDASEHTRDVEYRSEAKKVSLKVMRCIFRCTILGILIAVCMKLQSFYLILRSENIFSWFIGDMSSALFGRHEAIIGFDYSMPTHYSSLLVALATCVVFLYGSVRLGSGSWFNASYKKMAAVVAFLVADYLLIGAFPGFSILLSIGVLLAIYGLFDPSYGRRQVIERGGKPSVS